MDFYRKEKTKNEIFTPQLFSSQQFNHKINLDCEKKSNINSSEILIYHNKKAKEEQKNLTNDCLNDNLAQNNNENNLENDKIKNSNSSKNMNDFIIKDKEKENQNMNINNEKINNIELDNEWNESEINFCDISMVSKINSCENNNEQSNIIENNILFKSENLDLNNDNINKENNIENNKEEDKNEIFKEVNNNNKNIKSSFISNSLNSPESKDNYKNKIKNKDDINLLKKEYEKLEEKLKREQNINKDKSYYIEILKKALNDNFLNNNKSNNNKNSLNISIVLEYSKCKLENENLKKNIIMQKILCDDIKNEYQTLKKERDKLLEKINLYKNTINEKNEKLEEFETKLKEKQIMEEQLNIKLNQQKQICFNLKKDMNNLTTKNLELIELNEKINKNRTIINLGEKVDDKYYEKNKEINKLKLENNNININDEQEEMVNNNIINNSCKNIEDFSKKIKIYYEKFNDNKIQIDSILLKTLKDYIDNINPDFNGNISLNDKLKIIFEFIHFIKTKLELLFNHYEIFQKNNFNFDRIKNEESENNIFASSNGQNNENNNENSKKRILNNNNILNNAMFKKINFKQYKSNIFANNDLEESKKIDNNDFLSKTKNNFFENKKLTAKTNISEISKSPLDITSNNSRIKQNKIDDLFNNIFKEKLKQKKNAINLKSNENKNLTLMNINSQSNSKNFLNSFIKSSKKSEMDISNDISKQETNIFPSNKKVLSIKDRNNIIFSSNNSTRKNIKTKDENDNKSLFGTNLKENIPNNHNRKTTFPLSLLLTNTNSKTMINYKNSIEAYTAENNKIVESSYKKISGKNDKNDFSLSILKKELFSDNNKRKKNREINELAEEIMKPTFLKKYNTISIDNKHEKEIIKLNPFKAIKRNKLLFDLNKRKK